MARSKGNEFLAGIFILVTLVALAGILIAIGNWENLYRDKMVYYVEFDQAPMVRTGMPVLLGGQIKGRVTDIDMKWSVVDQETGAQRFYFVLGLELPAEIVLRRDADIAIEAQLIGETAWVNIRSIGCGDPAIDTETTHIKGRSGSPMEAAVEALGITEKEKAEIADTIENLKVITASLRETAPKIAAVTDNMEAVTADLKEKMPGIIAKADETMTKMKSAAEHVDGILAENRATLKTSIDNVAALTELAKKDFADLLDSLKATSQDVQTLVAANRMNLSDAMVNIRQTSEQLKAASVEIRRAPWRLLYKPDDRESDTMNVFDASRNYANAVADLRSTATTFKALLELKKDGVPVDAEVLAAMFDRLKAGIAKYEEAEAALWEQWGNVAE